MAPPAGQARTRPPRAGSPLLARRGGGWHFDVIDVPLADLKAGAKAAGGSLNDGLLAAVIGGFRRYHERYDAPLDRLIVGFPISLRTQDDPQGGNRFTGARFAAPMAERDPAARIAAVRQFVLTARAASAAAADAVPAALAPALGWLPAPVIGIVSGRLTSTNDVQVSSIPGVPYPVYHRGLADHAHVPVRPAARLRRDDHPDLPRRGVLYRHQHRYVGDRRSRRARR